jgi:hypothetical protein
MNSNEALTRYQDYQGSQTSLLKAISFFKGKTVVLGLITAVGVASLTYLHFFSGSNLFTQAALYGTPAVGTLETLGLATLRFLIKKRNEEKSRVIDLFARNPHYHLKIIPHASENFLNLVLQRQKTLNQRKL